MMYIEEALRDHPHVKRIQAQRTKQPVIWIGHYGEIFNRHSQNFRMQKKRPAFILAKKEGLRVHTTPATYGIGRPYNYYFSHILNCPFDCRYCFLQGMYRSAHYLLFMNHEDFQSDMEKVIVPHETTFFSGYDGDSLAFETHTGFLTSFLPFFQSHPEAELEIRTKSSAIAPLLNTQPLPNVVIAYSLNPAPLAQAFEKKAPSLEARLKALLLLQKKGWPIGLRFDPILYVSQFSTLYRTLFHTVFTTLDPTLIHSVTLGTFRLPKPLYKKMWRTLAGREPLLAQCSERSNDKMGLPATREKEMLALCKQEILKWIPNKRLFVCQ